MYPKCNLVNRLLAYIIDGIIVGLFAIPAIIILIIKDDSLTFYTYPELFYFLLILFFIPGAIYEFIKDGLGKGQSWGKKLMGLMVVNLETNTPCTKGKSVLRTLISAIIVSIPLLNLITWLVEPIMVLVTKDGRKAADLAVKTQVIEVKNYNGF